MRCLPSEGRPGLQPLPSGLSLLAKLRITSQLFSSNLYLTNPTNNLTRQCLFLPRASRITLSFLKARDCLADRHQLPLHTLHHDSFSPCLAAQPTTQMPEFQLSALLKGHSADVKSPNSVRGAVN